MTSIMHSLPAFAVRKQSTAVSGCLRRATQLTSSSGMRSSMTTQCIQSRSIGSQTPFQSLRAPSSVSSSTQQRRTFLAQLKRQSQTVQEDAAATTPPPAAPKLKVINLPYFVRRTPSNQLPVYLVTKAGGTKQQTKIQKTEGDVDALRRDLEQYLGLEADGRDNKKSRDITINRLNGNIIVKGWRKNEITQFLSERNF
ncbi:mitochondrial large subunit ribosomal protein-domain-containing protein [Aspergillus karnatakaensis]|uniref:mitochondrial 54S ribosomal protein mL49 n=1 Tax=Aspergillus karnatakaensis TaxID=1810916 RepID=UPI003CCCE26B